MDAPLTTLTSLPQAEVIQRLRALHFPDCRSSLDPTYGTGRFYRDAGSLTVGGDRLSTRARDCVMDYRWLPFADRSVDLVIFDPPFQPATSSPNPGKIARRFTKIGRTCSGGMQDLRDSVLLGIDEARRVARVGVIVKVQDYIHSHRHVYMTGWVTSVLGDPYDLVHVQSPTQKMKALNWSTPRSVWRNHASFYVYRWQSRR